MPTDEEFQEFIRQNKELIEKMMEAQKESPIPSREVRMEIAEDARENTIAAAKLAKDKTEDFVSTTYHMLTDAEVQKHFMTMGMEFIAGLSAMVDKAPIPDKIKNAASDLEKNAKTAACKNNKDCPAKKKAQKIDIN